MKLKIEIKNRWTGKVLFEFEKEENSVRKTLYEAIKSDANLEGANLRGANLGGADLRDADLGGADLRDADLEGANLRGANLGGADLRDADLEGANLGGANLRGANLGGADLRDADLEGANLEGANLVIIKRDMFSLLLYAIPEVKNLKNAIKSGMVDGSTYTGECACLCGTLEKSSNQNIVMKIFDLRDSSRPIEKFFLGIRKGDTPETSQFSKIALEWVDEFEMLFG